jgi:hypothetical protein
MRRQQLAHAASMVPAGYSLIGMVVVTAEAGQELFDTLAEAPDKLGVALAALAEGLGGRADLARRRPMGGPTRLRCCGQAAADYSRGRWRFPSERWSAGCSRTALPRCRGARAATVASGIHGRRSRSRTTGAQS